MCNAGPTSGCVRLLHIPSQAEADGCRVYEEVVVGEPVPLHPPTVPLPASSPPPLLTPLPRLLTSPTSHPPYGFYVLLSTSVLVGTAHLVLAYVCTDLQLALMYSLLVATCQLIEMFHHCSQLLKAFAVIVHYAFASLLHCELSQTTAVNGSSASLGHLHAPPRPTRACSAAKCVKADVCSAC